MPDRWSVALAIAAAIGALRPGAVPLVVGGLAVLAALLVRRPVLLCAAVALLTSALASRALAGLSGVEEVSVTGDVVLLTDPEPGAGGLRADVRMAGRRLELQARGAVAEALRDRLAGERLVVRGDLSPAPPDAPWLIPRHVAGRLVVHRVEPGSPPDVVSRAANGLRRTLVSGAAPLSPRQRSLFTGLVIGDDRDQPAGLADDFRGAGLTHLLAVSGQNVAFVLVLAGPLARRLRLWPRLGATLAVVAMFGLVTRFEPSVLRAGAMAALAAVTVTIGRPTSRTRVLALAVAALLIVDPLLVHAVGFRLSVAAAAAIVLLAPPIAAVLPGPRWLAAPLGVTVAAQLGVAPVLLTTFGPLPVSSLPANLLAVPAAGAVMVWGLTAGLLAGVVGGTGAELLHLPSRLLLTWIEEVASRSAAAPLGELGAWHLAVLAAGLGLAVLARRSGRPMSWRQAGVGIAAAGLVAAVLAAQAPPPLRTVLGPGLVRWHAAGVDVVALGGGGWQARPGATDTLERLRRAGVGSMSLLVVVDRSVPAAVVEAVADRHPAGVVLVPGDLADRPDVPVVVIPPEGLELDVGPMFVAIVRGEDRWVVEARPARRDSG